MLIKLIKNALRKFLKPQSFFEQKFAARYLSFPTGEKLHFISAIKQTEEGNDELYRLLKTNKPLMATRFGNVELLVLMNYLMVQHGKMRWHPNIKARMFKFNGMFPSSEKSLEKFAMLYLEEIKKIDVLGVWHNKGEEDLHRKYFPKAQLVDLVSYESFFYQQPWTKILTHKKVLIIHPYANSITSQYTKRRQKIFLNQQVLPEFDLKTLKPFHCLMDRIDPQRSWFDELDQMKESITKVDFDIALIAAGSFGLPIAGFIKSLNKQGVHIGGALQLLFGIIGQRWEEREHKKYFNDYWVRPGVEEMPSLDVRLQIDNNSYW